jgi:hypothetical protein
MIILKTIVDSKDFSYFNRNKMAIEYTNTLDEEGWVNSLLEGGYISPDFSTIFYYGRSPYEGQLIQFNKDTEGYNKILNRLIEKGDFVSYNIK